MAEPKHTEGVNAAKKDDADPYWWTPWAVLVGLVLFGALGYLGKLGGRHGGPTAADVTEPSPAGSAK